MTFTEKLTQAANDHWDEDVSGHAQTYTDGHGDWHAVYMQNGRYGVHHRDGSYHIVFASDGVEATDHVYNDAASALQAAAACESSHDEVYA